MRTRKTSGGLDSGGYLEYGAMADMAGLHPYTGSLERRTNEKHSKSISFLEDSFMAMSRQIGRLQLPWELKNLIPISILR